MRILFTSFDNSNDINTWSGITHFAKSSLERQGLRVVPFHDFTFDVPFSERVRNLYIRLVERRIHNIQLEPAILKKFADPIQKAYARHSCDIVFSPLTGVPVTAYVDPSIPIVSYGDATKYDWISTYNDPGAISNRSWNIIERVDFEILFRHRAIVFSSHWAKRKAMERYPEFSKKIHVVPFGANLVDPPSEETVERRLDSLPSDEVRLLFIGKEWERKGGSVAIQLAQTLHDRNIPVRLRIIGCHPPQELRKHSFVEVYGFLDKSLREDRDQIHKAMLDSHFLVMFSRADCTPVVFCEANAFGIPIIATSVGGIPTIVSEGVNGSIFPIPVNLRDVCDFITSFVFDKRKYRELSLRSRRHYDCFLNWGVAGQGLRRIIESISERDRNGIVEARQRGSD